MLLLVLQTAAQDLIVWALHLTAIATISAYFLTTAAQTFMRFVLV